MLRVKQIVQGLGMGLSISYSIIENHGSTLKVDSVLGQYTEFSFQLPLYKDKLTNMKWMH